ncbi:MAG: hypothetical protein GY758_31145 [Fuerstiella sp.]|jgi:hypothetical protein|nr:hypothetical protein [Fuerstiella sp.]MCP4508813.1 hypothetical protein [Fuerstiella sp.]
MSNQKVVEQRAENRSADGPERRKIRTFAKRVFLIIPTRIDERTNHATQPART